MWRRRFVSFWLGVAIVIALVASMTTWVAASPMRMFEPNVIAEVTQVPKPSENNEIVVTYNESDAREEAVSETEDSHDGEAISISEDQTVLLETEPEVIQEEMIEEEKKSYASLLSEVQSTATGAVEEDDPQAIKFVEELEDGTRIYEFKDGTYTIPSNYLKRTPVLSENGYVEKITELPHYVQQSYPYTKYGGFGTVSSHGCGITSCAMVYSYLLDYEIRPDELAEEYGRYNTKHGSAYSLFTKTAEDFGLEVTQVWSWKEVKEALELGCVVIANVQSDTIFTKGGHFIVYYGITEDGKILIQDPNIYNYGEWSGNILKDGFKNGFDQKYCNYSFPCWIYAPKDIDAIANKTSVNY